MKNELVSVVVISYNASSYIRDALDSIMRQSYRPIELIVSDDCSKDDTVAIAENWVSLNKSCFRDVKMITTPVNSGIPANCNRGIRASTGKYIKLIGADDILTDSCIQKNIDFIRNHPEVSFVFSRLSGFKANLNEQELFPEIFSYHIEKFNLPADRQHEELIKGNFPPAPTAFYLREAIEKAGYFDEELKLLEDHPMWIKATRLGYKLYFMDSLTVMYRITGDNISKSGESAYMNENYLESLKLLYRKYLKPNKGIKVFFYNHDFYINLLIHSFIIRMGNKPSLYSVARILKILSPLYVCNKFGEIFLTKK